MVAVAQKIKEVGTLHDKHAHVRLDKTDIKIENITESLIKMQANSELTCKTLQSLALKLKPITFTITATGYIQKAILFICPVIVVAGGIWKIYDEWIHNHVP